MRIDYHNVEDDRLDLAKQNDINTLLGKNHKEQTVESDITPSLNREGVIYSDHNSTTENPNTLQREEENHLFQGNNEQFGRNENEIYFQSNKVNTIPDEYLTNAEDKYKKQVKTEQLSRNDKAQEFQSEIIGVEKKGLNLNVNNPLDLGIQRQLDTIPDEYLTDAELKEKYKDQIKINQLSKNGKEEEFSSNIIGVEKKKIDLKSSKLLDPSGERPLSSIPDEYLTTAELKEKYSKLKMEDEISLKYGKKDLLLEIGEDAIDENEGAAATLGVATNTYLNSRKRGFANQQKKLSSEKKVESINGKLFQNSNNINDSFSKAKARKERRLERKKNKEIKKSSKYKRRGAKGIQARDFGRAAAVPAARRIESEVGDETVKERIDQFKRASAMPRNVRYRYEATKSFVGKVKGAGLAIKNIVIKIGTALGPVLIPIVGVLLVVIMFMTVLFAIIGDEQEDESSMYIPITISGTYKNKKADLKITGEGITIEDIKGEGDANGFTAKTKEDDENGKGIKTVKAEYTAFGPPWDEIEGWGNNAYDSSSQDEDLKAGRLVAAAPSSVPFLTRILVDGTNTKQDGKVYIVKDRGGAITQDGDLYHFDLLMKTRAQQNSFGRRRGTAIIGGSQTAHLKAKISDSDASLIAQTAVKIAKDHVGTPYKVGGKSWSGGVDCGWLIYKAYKEAGLDIGSGNTRNFRKASIGKKIPIEGKDGLKNALPGDVLCKNNPSWSGWSNGYCHVAIYAGNGYVVEAIEGKKNQVVYRKIPNSFTKKKGSGILHILRVSSGGSGSVKKVEFTGTASGESVSAEGSIIDGKVIASGWIGNGAAASGEGVEDMVKWAEKIAKGVSKHGYSQAYRECPFCHEDAKPDYDCSSFVTAALAHNKMGKDFENACKGHALTTFNMGDVLKRNGWKNLGNIPIPSIKRGDILLNPSRHVEIWVGDNKTVGAHDNKDGKSGESKDNEICVQRYWHFWTQVWRYEGNDKE